MGIQTGEKLKVKGLLGKEKIFDYLLSFDTFARMGRLEEGQEYVTIHLDRLIKTVQFIPRLEGNVRVLELGASPYFMTLMVVKYLGYEVIPANFFGDYGEPAFGEDEIIINSPRYEETITLRYKIFNVERDPFPYSDGEFDIVLCCEILEHLVLDPSHMLREIHRVLRPNGFLVVTTPNLIRLENALTLLRGKSILYPYSGYGVYGRHNREFTPSELIELLRIHDFNVQVVVDDVYSHSIFHRILTKIGPLRWRKDTLFALGQKFGMSVQCYPDFLYCHQWNRRCITRNTIIMGDADIFQLGHGWHALENWPPRVRWSGREAEAELKPIGNETTFCFRGYSGPKPTKGEIWINGQKSGTFQVEAGKNEVILPLPEGVRAEIARGNMNKVHVRFCVANPFVGIRDIPGSTDQRELGVAVERMWLS